MENTFVDALKTPMGNISFEYSKKGLTRIEFKKIKGEKEKIASKLNKQIKKELGEYFDGKRTDFDLPLDFEGTDFQVRAWKALIKIPFGQTRSYAQQAKAVGQPKAFRAVGNANGKNPIPIVIPCHRVLASSGALGGFSSGLPKKRFLLKHEGVSL